VKLLCRQAIRVPDDPTVHQVGIGVRLTVDREKILDPGKHQRRRLTPKQILQTFVDLLEVA
jgi:hypothetical protein